MSPVHSLHLQGHVGVHGCELVHRDAVGEISTSRDTEKSVRPHRSHETARAARWDGRDSSRAPELQELLPPEPPQRPVLPCSPARLGGGAVLGPDGHIDLQDPDGVQHWAGSCGGCRESGWVRSSKGVGGSRGTLSEKGWEGPLVLTPLFLITLRTVWVGEAL